MIVPIAVRRFATLASLRGALLSERKNAVQDAKTAITAAVLNTRAGLPAENSRRHSIPAM